MASCTGIYKNYERPQNLTQNIDSLYRNTTENVVKADTANYGNTPWQQVFTDPQLQTLINKALANNTNLLNADLNIQQIQGSMTSWDFNKASKTYAFPIAASWQFGSMGTIRNTKKQYEMNLEMTKAAKQATRTAIIANVANLYYTLQMLDEQLKTTQATIEIWAENVRAMEAMKEGGMTTQAAVSHAAEMKIAAAFYGVNIAKSAFYPSLNITAQGSWTNNAGMIVNPGKILATLLGSITQPLFTNGKLKANLKITQLQYEAAQNDFKSTLLNAGQEVSNALAQYQAAAQKEEACKLQVAELTTALDNTKMLFQHSTGTSYLETLTAQQSLIQVQLSLISDKFDKVQAAINLYQALGGGREVETNNNN